MRTAPPSQVGVGGGLKYYAKDQAKDRPVRRVRGCRADVNIVNSVDNRDGNDTDEDKCSADSYD